jgi:tagatose 1,6-diphosphate aldolase
MELKNYGIMNDGEIDVIIKELKNGDPEKGRAPEYKFKILLHNTDVEIGHINLRLGNSEKVVNYIGHVGYGINEEHRGKKYSAKACNIIKNVIKDNSLNKVIITCNPDNFASRSICESIGAKLIEIIDIPTSSNAYSKTEPQKCRYEWIID